MPFWCSFRVATSLKSIPQQRNRTHKQFLPILGERGAAPGIESLSNKGPSTSKFKGASNENLVYYRRVAWIRRSVCQRCVGSGRQCCRGSAQSTSPRGEIR